MVAARAHVFMYQGWTVSLTLDWVGTYGLEGYAVLHLGEAYMGRLAFASPHQDVDDAEELLTREAKHFVDDWHVEPQPESTDFAAL